MGVIKKIALFTLLAFAFYFLTAQQTKNENAGDNYRAIHWGLQQGLSQSENYHILKDMYGFIWIGSGNGLNRFDGNSFKVYLNDPKKNNTIPANAIQGLVEDSLHNIWFGTDKYLCRYDIKADTFTNLSSSGKNGNVAFWSTKTEVFCFEYGEYAITAYDIFSLKRRTIVKLTDADSLGYRGAKFYYSIFDAKSNSIWMLQEERNSLLRIFLATGKRERYSWPVPKEKNSHADAEGMRYDIKRNCIWINSGVGLLKFSLYNNKFYHIDALDEYVHRKDYNRFVGIDLDARGRIWFATDPKGIIIYDPDDQSVRFPFERDSIMQHEISDANAVIYSDRDGIIWSGFWKRKGVYQLNPFSPVATRYRAGKVNSNSLSADFVISCMDAGNGKIWVGTENGLNIFDPQQETFSMLYPNGIPRFKKGNGLIAIRIDTSVNKAWLVAGGIYEMNMSTRQCRPILFKDSNNQVISGLHEGYPRQFRNGLLLSSGFNGRAGIYILADNPVARQILSFPENSLDVFKVYTNENDKIFLTLRRNDSVEYQTYIAVDGKWKRMSCKLDSILWTTLTYNKNDQSYWVATFQQLTQYDKNFNLLKKYTTKEGIPEVEIYSIVPDKSGNIWFNTDRSIYQLNPTTGKAAKLTEKDGYEPQDFISMIPGYCAANGDLYFPGGAFGKGFDRIQPGKFVSTPASIYLQSLQINQQAFSPSTGVNNLEKLSIRYFENNITIKTGNIDYYSNASGGIRYKLEYEGKDADWQYAADYATIIYTALPPGKYKLTMQAGNAASEFIGPEKILLINISPAFWNTWWFRTSAAALLLGAFYILIRYRTQQRFKLRLERTGKEKQIAELGQKTAELQQQKIEMEMQALRAQMNPHFIFNSLNSINRFILQNNRAQASEYLTKFSKLVRMILQNSQASLISLESELESLNLYLDLEAVRFEHRFDYKISYPKDLDIEVLRVPPLVIQPFTENAIWHGLMHKEDKGQLDIDVSEENDYLYIKITDNGIGRKKAAELASKSATKHKSMGLRITKDRIAILQKTNGAESPIKIIDLEHEDGSAAGTEVIIKMPVIEEV